MKTPSLEIFVCESFMFGPSANVEGEGLVSCTAAAQQGNLNVWILFSLFFKARCLLVTFWWSWWHKDMVKGERWRSKVNDLTARSSAMRQELLPVMSHDWMNRMKRWHFPFERSKVKDCVGFWILPWCHSPRDVCVWIGFPQVVCKKYRNFDIPVELKGLTRYLDKAYAQDDFRYTCPQESEILMAYQSVARYLNK